MADIALRIELLDIEPLIWRRFLVPEQINLRRLHQVIQIVMGWTESHLYEFDCAGRRYGEPDPFVLGGDDVAQAVNIKLNTVVSRLTGDEFFYVYDFGDGWEHRLVVEQTRLDSTNPCPRLLDGAMACPPEDIGGPLGYAALQDTLAGRADEHGEMLLETIGEDFDPNTFDANDIVEALQPVQAGFRRF